MSREMVQTMGTPPVWMGEEQRTHIVILKIHTGQWSSRNTIHTRIREMENTGIEKEQDQKGIEKIMEMGKIHEL